MYYHNSNNEFQNGNCYYSFAKVYEKKMLHEPVFKKWQWRNHLFYKRNALKGRRLLFIHLTKVSGILKKKKKNWSSDVKKNTSLWQTRVTGLLHQACYNIVFGFAVCPTLGLKSDRHSFACVQVFIHNVLRVCKSNWTTRWSNLKGVYS